VAAGDDYVGVDLSLGMLRPFTGRAECNGAPARLVQADGKSLPFGDARFDAVLLIQVFGAMARWRRLVAEARRVLRPAGALIIGRSLAPADGVDARMKRHLADVLKAMGVEPDRGNVRDDVQHWLGASAAGAKSVIAASWHADRTPRGFLERHRTGARFAALPGAVKDEALRRLGAWADATFGSRDGVFSEPHAFELQAFTFADGVGAEHAGHDGKPDGPRSAARQRIAERRRDPARHPNLAIPPWVNVVKIGGQSIMDRGRSAVVPVVDEIVANLNRHKMILGTGAVKQTVESEIRDWILQS
jgi:SAM-dependent methyltransferase